MMFLVSECKRSCPGSKNLRHKCGSHFTTHKAIALEHIAWREIQGTGHRGKDYEEGCFSLPSPNIENDTIKSPAQIEKVEEVPDNVTPYGEIERIPMTPMRKW